MNHSANEYTPLQNTYRFPKEFLRLNVSCLFSVMHENDNQAYLVRLMNLFAKCSCSTIGEVMALNWNMITNMRGFGIGTASFVLDLLDRINSDLEGFRSQHLHLKSSIRTLENVLMNIELKSRKCTLHKPDCSKIPMEAEILPYTELEDAIGWVDFDSVEQSVNFHKEYLQRLEYRLCRICFANEVKQLFKQRGTNLSPQYPV